MSSKMLTNPMEESSGIASYNVFPYGGNLKDSIKNPSKYKKEVQTVGPGQKVIIFIPVNANISAINDKKMKQLALAVNSIKAKKQLNNSSALMLTDSVVSITNLFDINLSGLTA